MLKNALSCLKKIPYQKNSHQESKKVPYQGTLKRV